MVYGNWAPGYQNVDKISLFYRCCPQPIIQLVVIYPHTNIPVGNLPNMKHIFHIW
jgi:hypothetical protein